ASDGGDAVTPAEELRAAAERLGALAEGEVEGWECWVSADRRWAFVGFRGFEDGVQARCADDDTAEYIAAMHPGVGRALAEWLKDAAVEIDGYDGPHPEFVYINALAIARAINGTTP